MATKSIVATWQDAIDTLRQRKTTPAAWRDAWSAHMADWDVNTDGPRPIWFPDKDSLQNSGIATILRDTGHSDFASFHDWSVQQQSEFWSAVIKRLEIQFERPPESILDLSRGVEQPQWLPGAKMNIMDSCFQADPQAVAVIFGSVAGELQYVTYGELKQQVNRVVAGLRRSHRKPGDRIAIVMPMTLNSVAIYLGIIAAGCAVVSIADSFAAPEISRRLQIARADAVFCSGQVRRAGKEIDIYTRVLAAEPPDVIVVGDNRVDLRASDQTYDQFMESTKEAPVEPWHYTNAEEPIGILYSSGTTGDPKAIPWDHTTAIRGAADGMLLQDIREGDVVVWPTNLGWMMGPWLILASLINRATIGLYGDAPLGEAFGQFVERAKVTMLGVVPTMVRCWRTSECMEDCDWSTIRCFSSTGEASSPDDMFYLSSLAGIKPIIEYCGGTEIGGGYISSTVIHSNIPGAFTTATLGSRFVILDDDGHVSNEGTLFLVPPTLGSSRRLLNRDHHTTYFSDTPPGPDGELLRRHGDYFRRLKGGCLVAGGRVDDTMNVGGIKVSAAEIERAVSGVLGILESAAISVPEADFGPDQLIVYVVAENDISLTAEELFRPINKAIRAELNPLFKVHRVVVVEELPRTASNKVMRRKLREAYQRAASIHERSGP